MVQLEATATVNTLAAVVKAAPPIPQSLLAVMVRVALSGEARTGTSQIHEQMQNGTS